MSDQAIPSTNPANHAGREPLAREVARCWAIGAAACAIAILFSFLIVRRPEGSPYWDWNFLFRLAGPNVCAAFPLSIYLVNNGKLVKPTLTALTVLPVLWLFWGSGTAWTGLVCLCLAAACGVVTQVNARRLDLVPGSTKSKDLACVEPRRLDDAAVFQAVSYAILNMAALASGFACVWFAMDRFDPIKTWIYFHHYPGLVLGGFVFSSIDYGKMIRRSFPSEPLWKHSILFASLISFFLVVSIATLPGVYELPPWVMAACSLGVFVILHLLAPPTDLLLRKRETVDNP